MVEVDRSDPTTVVGSVAELLAGARSTLALDTCAVLATDGIAAAPTATVRVMSGNDCPGSRNGGCVQVTSCPAAVQLQPVPVPDTKLSPAGSVSVTVTTLSSRCWPAAFATRSVYTPFAPEEKLPAWVFVMERSTVGSLVADTICASSSTRSPPAAKRVVAEVCPGSR